jgi:hypothetical protein
MTSSTVFCREMKFLYESDDPQEIRGQSGVMYTAESQRVERENRTWVQD